MSNETISFTDEPIVDWPCHNLHELLAGELFSHALDAAERVGTICMRTLIAYVPAFARDIQYVIAPVAGTASGKFEDCTARVAQFDFIVSNEEIGVLCGVSSMSPDGKVVRFRCEMYRDSDDKFFYNMREV